METCCEVPIVEKLRSVPNDYRTCVAIQWAEDGRATGHRFIPVGYMMHEAAEEIERLNALVAMQAEAITEYFDVYANADKKPHWCNRVFESRSKVETALSATKETVSAWQLKRDAEALFSAADDLSISTR